MEGLSQLEEDEPLGAEYWVSRNCVSADWDSSAGGGLGSRIGSAGVGGIGRVWVEAGGEVRGMGIAGGMITPPVDGNGVGRPE